MNRYKVSMLFGSIGIILVCSLMILSTYAYFTIDLNEVETSDINLVAFNENVDVIFNDTSNLSIINAYTGEEVIKEFNITNNSNYSVYYDIVLENVVNNFSDRNYLVYSLTSTNNGAKRNQNPLPKMDAYVSKNVYLPPKSEHNYTMIIIFLKKDEDQNIDQNKTFSSNIKIVPSSGLNIGQKLNDEGSLFDAMINDESINYTNSSTFGNTIYYYRGKNANNNVVFNNMCFKIIRSDDDNNIKMIYNGQYLSEKCSNDIFINKYIFNSKSNNNSYVGYMYGKASSNNYESEHENISSSAIKIEIENWFNDNFGNLKKYISNSSIYCNDRTLNKFIINGVLYDKKGYAKTNSGYYDINNLKYDYICNNINDRFSVTGNNSNKSSLSAVGLVTYNEYIMSKDDNKTSFLDSKYEYWSLTPAYFNGSDAYNYVVGNGKMIARKVDNEYGVRPVITLLKDVKYNSGDGSINNPFIIEGV